MPMIFSTIANPLGICSGIFITLLVFWKGVREWRQFLLKKPYTPAPRWIERLISYLWLLMLPWFAESMIRDFQHAYSKSLFADSKSLFVAGFLAFCVLIGLASKRWGSDKKNVSTDLR